MIRKLVAIVLAVLINLAVLTCFGAWSSTTLANASVSPQHVEVIRVLPTITVRPTAAQLRRLRDTNPPHARMQGPV